MSRDGPHGRSRFAFGMATLAFGAALAGLPGDVALAQPGPAQQRQGPSPLPPAPPERIEPEPRQRGGAAGAPQTGLDGTTPPRGGVVRPPPGVDPGIQAPVPAPDPGTTRVIPPPGTPGGDPRVHPR
jgi:hypothetical protein